MPRDKNGFLYAQVGGDTGWVWSKNVQIQSTSPVSPSAGGSAAEGPPATTVSSAWDKPDPKNSVFHGDEGDCGETGKGGDTDTNGRKNRVDVPDQYHLVTWDAINTPRFSARRSEKSNGLDPIPIESNSASRRRPEHQDMIDDRIALYTLGNPSD